MELTNEFHVNVPVERAWAVLTDIETIAPCMPGAALEEIEGDEYRGGVKIKVGPITAQYKGKATFLSKDDVKHIAVLKAEGRDTKGQGNASATITATLKAAGDGTDVVQLHNPSWSDGQAGSLARGVAWAGERGLDAIVCGLGDQPFIPADAWQAVADADRDAAIVVATYGGRRRNPVRLARSVWPLLATEGDEGARPLMAARPDLVLEVACDGNPADIDTAEDLLSWS